MLSDDRGDVRVGGKRSCGVQLAGSIVRPIRRVADASRALAEGTSPEPLPTQGTAELASLSLAFNEMAKQLADALGGEIAASRPICDSGWLPMDRQVGSSGQTVAPKLYLALGISGAIQHIVGMKGARAIIAVNKDSEAPIFEIADYAIVGNLFDIVPPLIEEVKRVKAGG